MVLHKNRRKLNSTANYMQINNFDLDNLKPHVHQEDCSMHITVEANSTCRY